MGTRFNMKNLVEMLEKDRVPLEFFNNIKRDITELLTVCTTYKEGPVREQAVKTLTEIGEAIQQFVQANPQAQQQTQRPECGTQSPPGNPPSVWAETPTGGMVGANSPGSAAVTPAGMGA